MDGYVGGFVSGIAQTIVGYPLDTMKTWNQNITNIKQPARTWSNLWRGIQYPMIQLPIVCSISFGLYENLYKASNDRIIAGAGSGFVRTFLVCPLEYYKIRLQQQVKPRWLECYRNLPITLMKEMPSATVYYSSYHYFKDQQYPIVLSGSLAGMLSWTTIYPLDTINTRVQSGIAKSMTSAIRQGNLWTGLSMCLVRAVLTNGIGFYVYEKTYTQCNRIM